MVQLKADGTISAFFGPIKERAEILDDNGALLGYFEPANSGEDALYRHAATLFDPDEVRESLSTQGPGSTLDEIMQRLRASETL